MTNSTEGGLMAPRDRPNRGAAYLAAFLGQLIGFGFAFLTCGAGGVASILRNTSSGEGIGRLFMGKSSHG